MRRQPLQPHPQVLVHETIAIASNDRESRGAGLVALNVEDGRVQKALRSCPFTKETAGLKFL